MNCLGRILKNPWHPPSSKLLDRQATHRMKCGNDDGESVPPCHNAREKPRHEVEGLRALWNTTRRGHDAIGMERVGTWEHSKARGTFRWTGFSCTFNMSERLFRPDNYVYVWLDFSAFYENQTRSFYVLYMTLAGRNH
ncbi:hypothetical protein WG66_001706 [Moniliophthora roreri]|nr:hypothetical protein WG66_001706 [Moniliophthora roreri]